MLDNLKKPAAELKTDIEDWAYVFKEPALKSDVIKIPQTKVIEDIELIENRNPGIKEFLERIDVKNLPDEVRKLYMEDVAYFNGSMFDVKVKNKIEGIEIGKTEGIKIGEANMLQKVFKGVRAIKMLKIMTDAEIANELGLTVAQVADIKINEL